MTILESGEDKSGPSDLLGHIVEQDHGHQSRQECGESSNQFWARARSGATPYRIVTAINKISCGASRLVRYQRSGTRHRKLRRARSRTRALPLTRAVTINAGTADPRTFSSTRAVSLRQGELPARSSLPEQRPGPWSSRTPAPRTSRSGACQSTTSSRYLFERLAQPARP
jgi:hypothetical protein